MKERQAVSDLTYINYRINRAEYGMTASAAARIYSDAEALEARFRNDPMAQHMRKVRVLAETRRNLGEVS